MPRTASAPSPKLPLPLSRIGWFIAALPLFGLALLGVLLPLVPGLPFAFLGALCLVNASPGMHARLRDVALLQPAMAHWRRARGRSPAVQLGVAGWLLVLGFIASAAVAWDALFGARHPSGR